MYSNQLISLPTARLQYNFELSLCSVVYCNSSYLLEEEPPSLYLELRVGEINVLLVVPKAQLAKEL
jgi:hypothetical protein